jgi:hypothetical protein
MSINIFGSPRAEADGKMLDHAFVRTQDYEVLTNTRDFNYVVGRRGTGKSALYLKLIEHIRSEKKGYVFSYVPKDYEQLSLRNKILEMKADYPIARSIARVAWRVSLLMELIKNLKTHYKYKQLSSKDYLDYFSDRHHDVMALSTFNKVLKIVSICCGDKAAMDVPGEIARQFDVERLNDEVEAVIRDIGSPYFLLFDGLDDGWSPEPISTAVLGGLAICVSDFRERNSDVCVLLFFRDNIFRSLQYFDPDFSRHIEGSTLRLAWDDHSLFQLICDRLRVALGIKDMESDNRVWNRIVSGDLKNINGFKACLNYTLFRPRDIIVLLNETYSIGHRAGRDTMIGSDIEMSSKQVSKNRIMDLVKEYQDVFPGLSILIDSFNGQAAYRPYQAVVDHLGGVIEYAEYSRVGESDFALFGSGEECFFALYSVGFIGLEKKDSGALHFCHDGSPAEISAERTDQKTCIHPCYWKALNVQSEVLNQDVRIDVYDDVDASKNDSVGDQRTRRLGQIVAELPRVDEGNADASKFEEWVLNAVRILFSGKIANAELHANEEGIQRRDIIGTIVTNDGFWGGINKDYGVRDIVFEVKNFSEMKLDNYRQALSYSGKSYGKFVIIVNRSPLEHLSNLEQGWVKEFWYQHEVLILTLPAPMLSRCISKLRTRERFDYVEDKLIKRLAQYRRSYLSLRHEKSSNKKSRR